MSSISKDKFIFRYEYLLIEVGTFILRKLFDDRVGTNFSTYLSNNNAARAKLQLLINSDIINGSQKSVLPPIDNNPTSSSFDITLLSCLLRNICGLRKFDDPVWKTIPGSYDYSIEADIVRLREDKNIISHIGTVLITEADLNKQLGKLRALLRRLSNHLPPGVVDIESKLREAENLEIDQDAKKKFDNIMQQWREMDNMYERGISELSKKFEKFEQRQTRLEFATNSIQQDHTDVKISLQYLKDTLKEIRDQQNSLIRNDSKFAQSTYYLHDSNKNDESTSCTKNTWKNIEHLRTVLVETYKRDCSYLPVSPLYEEENEDFDKIYKKPTLHRVHYHRPENTVEKIELSSYNDIFFSQDQTFRNIYLTGDATIGKTSLCKYLCFLWMKCNSDVKQTLHNDDFIARFDFVFYVSLTDTYHNDVVSMIMEQYFNKHNEELENTIKHVLKYRKCLVLLDGYDEWTPKPKGKKVYKIPVKIHSDNCVYMTACRSYKIENVRLSRKDIDHHVRITGIHGESLSSYVEDIVNHINKENGSNKDFHEFVKEIHICDLADLLCIPLLASHLIMVWFAGELTKTSRSYLYCNVLNMLFKQKKMESIVSPVYTTSSFTSLPVCMTNLKHVEQNMPSLKKLSLLSFVSLFRQSDDVSSLVFTRDQLSSDPYLLSHEETDFLCKVGVLSKNKVVGVFEERMQRISFLHSSYKEFLAAMFVACFDTENIFEQVVTKWKCLEDVVGFQNFFLFLAGFSYKRLQSIFHNVYRQLSDDLKLTRRNAIFLYDRFYVNNTHWDLIMSLQCIVVNCFKEIKRSNSGNVELKLDDYILDECNDAQILEQVMITNRKAVKFLWFGPLYHEMCDTLENIECLSANRMVQESFDKLFKCLQRNVETLNTFFIKGCYSVPLIPNIPVRNLCHLTSLCLSYVRMQHDGIKDLLTFLSNNDKLENLKLSPVICEDHSKNDEHCHLVLDLSNSSKLTLLWLFDLNILCSRVNTARLQYLRLCPYSDQILNTYKHIFDNARDSFVEHLEIDGCHWMNKDTVNALITCVNTLPNIKLLRLWNMTFNKESILQPDQHVKQLRIEFYGVTMDQDWLHELITVVSSRRTEFKIEFYACTIPAHVRNSVVKTQHKDSMDYLLQCISSTHNLSVTRRCGSLLIETTTCGI